MPGQPALRLLPSVDRVLGALDRRGVLGEFPRRAVTLCVREAVEHARRQIREGAGGVPIEAIVDDAEARLRSRFGTSLRHAINASGIILHTNLGRAPLCAAAREAVADAAGYSTLEVDLATGGRGSRHAHLEGLLLLVTRAEAGFAVNNAAGAVVLSLASIAGDRQVAVSRGELVEIGGSFRMPDVMRESGARLAEVGTTNRTYLADYETAIDRGAAVLLKVHRSNFTQTGFTHDVAVGDLVALGARRGVPVIYDLGSGCLVDLTKAGLPAEPTVQDAVEAGPDLVLFSGDKLLGGPQAGLVVGRGDAVERARRHPLARAFRLDKLDLAALAATLRVYVDPEAAWREIPVLSLLGRPVAERRRLARRLAAVLRTRLGAAASVRVVETEGQVGGGSLPGVAIPSFAVALQPAAGQPEQWARQLREASLPVIGVVRDDELLLDVLALLPGDHRALPRLCQRLIASS
jgi:L-seryl-tRNA(Ser) seleniumtransferase